MSKDNRTALITGASSGIGREIARQFAADGYELILHGRDSARLAELKSELEKNFGTKTEIITEDLSEPGSAERIFTYLKKHSLHIDVLVNSAGFGINTIEEFNDPARVRELLEVLAVQPALLSHFCGKEMLKRGEGHILNISSIVAYFPLASTLTYSAAKTFLSAFTRYLRYEWQSKGLNITALEPGGTRTEYFRRNGIPIGEAHYQTLYPADLTARSGIRALSRNRKRITPGLIPKLSRMVGTLTPSGWLYAYQKRKRSGQLRNKDKHPGKGCALVTGASSGIGKDIAELLAETGYDLIIVGRRGSQLEHLKQEWETKFGITVTPTAMDLSEYDSAFDLYRTCTENGFEVDVLVNNAGFGVKTEQEIADPDTFERMMRLMMVNLTLLSHLFGKNMAERGRGYIMNVSSVSAYFPVGMMKSYGAVKAYILAYSTALHHELKSGGVGVTCLLPGVVATEFMDSCGLNIPQTLRWVSKAFFCQSRRVARHGLRRMFHRRLKAIPGVLTQLMIIAGSVFPEKWMYRLFIKIDRLRDRLNQNRQSEGEKS